MTFQTSDVAVSKRLLRQLTLVHALVSFLFNVVILAAAVTWRGPGRVALSPVADSRMHLLILGWPVAALAAGPPWPRAIVRGPRPAPSPIGALADDSIRSLPRPPTSRAHARLPGLEHAYMASTAPGSRGPRRPSSQRRRGACAAASRSGCATGLRFHDGDRFGRGIASPRCNAGRCGTASARCWPGRWRSGARRTTGRC